MFQLKNNFCILCFRQAVQTDSAGLKKQNIDQKPVSEEGGSELEANHNDDGNKTITKQKV